MDKVFEEEQAHLSQVYAQLLALRNSITAKLTEGERSAARDLVEMSEEIRPDFAGDDETMETLAAIETLNSVIDVYNQTHDMNVEKLRRLLVLLRQPYFAKVRLEMRPGRPARDVYIGSVGMTDDRSRPLIVDWRSPVASTYYSQDLGPTSFEVDGRRRDVNLLLRRHFDITGSRLNMYFDTTVAIQDSLLLQAITKHHSEKLQAITATIQREQNEVIRHEDVPVLLVNGIAGSGKTSVLLQRVAYLFYQERDRLDPRQVYLFTPNDVFGHYIDTVLPSLGESNPQTFTWRSFVASLGMGDRDSGRDCDPATLRRLEAELPKVRLEPQDLRELRVGDTVVLKASQVQSAVEKFDRFPLGPRFLALVKDELHERLRRRVGQMAHDEDLQEAMLGMDMDEQVEVFGETIAPSTEEETAELTRRYAERLVEPAHDDIESLAWLRFDRIGMRALETTDTLSAAQLLYLRVLVTGTGDRNARYVMIDEVQDYTVAQLMILPRYFSRAHFMLLGDENQAIRQGTATFSQIREVFAPTHGQVDQCELMTSYRSSPEITALFCSLMPPDERVRTSSVQRAGTEPDIRSFDATDVDAYVGYLRQVAEAAKGGEGLCAIVCDSRDRVRWLARQMGDLARPMGKNDILPLSGVVLIDLDLAKGLEFDHVVIPDAQESVYPQTPLARRRLYTAVSRAMHEVTIVSQGPLTPLLAR